MVYLASIKKISIATLLVWFSLLTTIVVCSLGGPIPSYAGNPGSESLLVKAGNDLPSGAEISQLKKDAEKDTMEASKDPNTAHAIVFLNDRFPSATECASCHPVQYRQWAISQHAYAQMSPVFNAMQGSIGRLTNGTLGDFCIRCHTPVGMNLKEKEFMSNIDRHPTSREGITCIVCHRLSQAYGKITGRLALIEGDITQPIYGPTGDNTALIDAIDQKNLITDKDKAGRKVHKEVSQLFQLTTSGVCGSCHDVTEANGFRLEEAFSEWKNSPANAKGISCQDCHMGKEPGRILGSRDHPDFEKENYAFGPAAKVGSYETPPRKLTNHMFVGPDHSVLPPSLFPFNVKAIIEESQKEDPSVKGLATIREWLEFNIEEGWGTDEFEDKVSADYKFTERWSSPDDRYDAREIIDENLVLLKEMRVQQLVLLRNGYVINKVVTDKADRNGIKFRVKVASGTDGHNVPTGFDGERLVWLYVRVMDAEGTVIHQSGDLDPNGDVRDLHSAYVHNRELPIDKELLSLQSKFLTFATRGAEREQVIAVPYSLTVTPFLQPETRSAVLLGRHFGARKHRKGIEPNGHRWGKYSVKKSEMTGKGPYKAMIQLKAGMVPVNLINKIKGVGFDYGLSARDIAKELIKGHQIIWETELTFDVDADHGVGSDDIKGGGE